MFLINVSRSFVVIQCLIYYVCGMVYVFTADNTTLQFADAEAAFGGILPTQGAVGTLQRAEPLDACEPLSNFLKPREASFAIIKRGNCVFDLKVWHAQQAGFQAAIVFNNEDGRELITMVAVSSQYLQEVSVPAIFVSKRSGETLMELSDIPHVDCLITPSFDNSTWSLVTLTFLFVLALSSVLGTFYVLRRHRLRRIGSRLVLVPSQPEPEGMPESQVAALKTSTFVAQTDGSSNENGTTETCAICLEDYEEGDKLRILPCSHEFHSACVDQWLTTRRPFCPVCKRDPRQPPNLSTAESNPPLLEGLLEETADETPRMLPWLPSFLPQLLAVGMWTRQQSGPTSRSSSESHVPLNRETRTSSASDEESS